MGFAGTPRWLPQPGCRIWDPSAYPSIHSLSLSNRVFQIRKLRANPSRATQWIYRDLGFAAQTSTLWVQDSHLRHPAHSGQPPSPEDAHNFLLLAYHLDTLRCSLKAVLLSRPCEHHRHGHAHEVPHAIPGSCPQDCRCP